MTRGFQKTMAASAIKLLGAPVIHHSHTGTVRTIYALIEEGVQVFDAGTESGVSEFRTKIYFLRADAPNWRRDERIVDEDNRSFILKNETDESDSIVCVVAAR